MKEVMPVIVNLTCLEVLINEAGAEWEAKLKAQDAAIEAAASAQERLHRLQDLKAAAMKLFAPPDEDVPL